MTRRRSDRIGLFPQNTLMNIIGQYPLSMCAIQLHSKSMLYGLCWGEGEWLLCGCDFGVGVEGEAVVVVFLVEVFFELVVVELFLLVPVADSGCGLVAVAHVVVVHEVIFIK